MLKATDAIEGFSGARRAKSGVWRRAEGRHPGRQARKAYRNMRRVIALRLSEINLLGKSSGIGMNCDVASPWRRSGRVIEAKDNSLPAGRLRLGSCGLRHTLSSILWAWAGRLRYRHCLCSLGAAAAATGSVASATLCGSCLDRRILELDGGEVRLGRWFLGASSARSRVGA